MGQPGRVSWVSKAVGWVATRLRGAFVWLQGADEPTPAAPAQSPQANPACAVADDAPAPAIDLVTGIAPPLECLPDHVPPDDSPVSGRRDSAPAQTPPQELEPDIGSGAGPDSTDAAHAAVPAACAPAKAWPASREQAERLVALLAGSPVACGSATAEELMELIDDADFTGIVSLIAGSDRTFDDLRLPAAKHAYERIMARPLGVREPVRFREPVHDLGVLQMLYAALREFAQREGVLLIIPPAGATAPGPTGEMVAHPAWWSCDALGQELKAPAPDLRAANGRVLARLFPQLSANVLQPAVIATLTSSPKPRRKAAVGSRSRSDARAAGQADSRSGPWPPDDPPVDAAMISGDPLAGFWLRGHGTAAWTIRLAMSRGTRILDVGALDRVRHEIELAAWERNCRRRVVAAVAAYVADPRGYDIEQVRKRIARKDLDPAAGTPFACHDEQALFDAWRRAHREADIPFDRSIGMPTVNVLAPDLIARLGPPFCAMLGVAPVEASIQPAPGRPTYAWDLRDDAA
jgi:hypothetical protein